MKGVAAAVCFEAPGATGGVERGVIGRCWEIDQDGAWVVEEPYDVASEDAGWVLDFTKPPGIIQGVIPDGYPNK